MEAGGAGLGYRPHLDGLRAVAVYLVVLFHAQVGVFGGGFIGVDVFFVLSGFLVTRLIVRDRLSGSFQVTHFYGRRIRRLLPAAILNLSVTAVVFAALASPRDVADASRAMTSAALYVSNWFFIRESADYFAADIGTSPVLHYWSLSVEEQFYIVWPLVLAALFAVGRFAGRRQVRAVGAMVVVGAVASLTAAVVIAREDPMRSYLGSDTRAYQLLAGAALALIPLATRSVGHRWAAVTSWLSLTLLVALCSVGTSAVEVGPITRGALTTVVTVALLCTLEASHGGVARRLLSRPALVYLGRISYGTYLWHWLVIFVVADAYAPSALVTAAVAAPAATALASLSYHLVEMPIRSTHRLRSSPASTLALGVAASVVVGVVALPQLLDRQVRHVDGSAVERVSVTGTPNTVDWQAASDENTRLLFDPHECEDFSSEACRYRSGRGQTVAVVGDSHALVLLPMMVDVAARHDASLWRVTRAGCPWIRGIRYDIHSPGCFDWQDRVFEGLLPRIDPDIVVFVNRPMSDPVNGRALVDREKGAVGDDPEQQRRLVGQRIESAVDDLRADGRRVVIVEPIPVAPEDADPFQCMTAAEFLDQCRFVTAPEPTAEELFVRRLAEAHTDVWSLSLDEMVCPYLPICDPVVGGTLVRSDDEHLTAAFALGLSDAVDGFLTDNRIVRVPER